MGYSSDDINKFLWMVRIGGSVYPEIKEKDYLSSEGGLVFLPHEPCWAHNGVSGVGA